MAALVALAFLLGLRLLTDNNIDFHLHAGRWILEHGTFPRKDTFTYTATHRDYIDVHWLFQVAAYGLYRLGGYEALSLANAGLATTLFALLVLRSLALGAAPWITCWLLLAAIAVVSPRMLMRPENVSFVFLAAVCLLLDRYRGGATGSAGPGASGKTGGRCLLVTVVLLHLLWANIQGLFPLGWIVVGAYWVEASVESRRPNRPLGAALAGSVAACLVNPYGIQGLLFPLELLTRFDRSNVFARQIAEFGPLWGSGFLLEDKVVVGLAVLLAAAGVCTFRGRRLHELLLALPFFGLSVVAVRNEPLFVVVAVPLTAAVLTDATRGALSRLSGRVIGWGRRLAPVGTVAFAAIVLGFGIRVATGAYYQRPDADPQFRTGIGLDESNHPSAAAEFMRRHRLFGRLLNTSNIGGGLGWALPQPVWTDARLEVIGEALFAEELRGVSRQGFGDLLARVAPDLVVCDHTVSWLEFLRDRTDWRLLYADEVACVYAREGYAGDLPALTPGVLLATMGLSREDERPDDVLARPAPAPVRRWLEGFTRKFVRQPRFDRLGFFCETIGWTDAAERLYVECVRRDPAVFWDVYAMLGTLYGGDGRYRLALASWERYLESRPEGDLVAFNELGIARGELGDLEGALREFGRALAMNPGNGEALINRAITRERLGDLAGARIDYSRALTVDPANDAARWGLHRIGGRGDGG